MKTKTIISVNNLSKQYVIGRKNEETLRAHFSSIFSKKNRNKEIFNALNNVSFEVEKGDVFGIIGKNGAGKSTLLKILSRITRPTSGKIEINGRVASLLEVGTGFHPELSGRENIFLNGTILGMTQREVHHKFDHIVKFSGVEKFIDTPVKHYSSGMYVRLAFAVAAHLDPEVLIIDEVLAVGDAEFQEKCLGKMREVAKDGRTVLFVSHHLGSVRQLCNKGILLEQGEIRVSGLIDNVIAEYQKANNINKGYSAANIEKEIFLSNVNLISDSSSFYHNENIRINFKIKHNIEFDDQTFLLIRIINQNDSVVGGSERKLEPGKNIYTYKITRNLLTKGHYKINAIIYRPAIAQYDIVEECCKFEILDNNAEFAHLETFDIGSIYLEDTWE